MLEPLRFATCARTTWFTAWFGRAHERWREPPRCGYMLGASRKDHVGRGMTFARPLTVRARDRRGHSLAVFGWSLKGGLWAAAPWAAFSRAQTSEHPPRSFQTARCRFGWSTQVLIDVARGPDGDFAVPPNSQNEPSDARAFLACISTPRAADRPAGAALDSAAANGRFSGASDCPVRCPAQDLGHEQADIWRPYRGNQLGDGDVKR